MARVISCDVCGEMCTPDDCRVMMIYKRNTVECLGQATHSYDLCLRCTRKYLGDILTHEDSKKK